MRGGEGQGRSATSLFSALRLSGARSRCGSPKSPSNAELKTGPTGSGRNRVQFPYGGNALDEGRGRLVVNRRAEPAGALLLKVRPPQLSDPLQTWQADHSDSVRESRGEIHSMNQEFPETVVWAAFHRSGGQCECTTPFCSGHMAVSFGRCVQTFSFAQRATSDGTGWQAHHRIPVVDGGEGTLTNCQILCVNCHQARHLPPTVLAALGLPRG